MIVVADYSNGVEGYSYNYYVSFGLICFFFIVRARDVWVQYKEYLCITIFALFSISREWDHDCLFGEIFVQFLLAF